MWCGVRGGHVPEEKTLDSAFYFKLIPKVFGCHSGRSRLFAMHREWTYFGFLGGQEAQIDARLQIS